MAASKMRAERCGSTAFDALITDVRLGAFNGLQLAVMARDTHPEIRVIVFSGFDDPVLRSDAEHIGACIWSSPSRAASCWRFSAACRAS